MGFQKWILTHGPGSPGHTARTIVKCFHNYFASNYIDSDEKDAFYEVYYQRLTIQEKFKNKSCLLNQFSDRMGAIIAKRDVPLFIFAIESLESNRFRSAISNDNISILLEVIRDEVAKLDDSLISLDFDEYKANAIYFFNSMVRSNTFKIGRASCRERV